MKSKIKFDFEGDLSMGATSRFCRFRKGKEGRPNFVFLNGLSYSTTNWLPVVEYLPEDSGLLLFDFRGQGRSLAHELEEFGEFTASPHVEDQTADVKHLVEHFGIEKIDYLVGLSYGGGIATHFTGHHPHLVGQLIVMAPYIMRLDFSHHGMRTLGRQWNMMKVVNPFLRHSMEYMEGHYNRFLEQYMEHRFADEIPDGIYREAAIRLSFGIMKYSAIRSMQNIPDHSFHLITAGRDTLIPKELVDEFWNKTPREKKQTWLHIEDAGHIVPSASPKFLAHWLLRIMKDEFSEGVRYDAHTHDFRVRHQSGQWSQI